MLICYANEKEESEIREVGGVWTKGGPPFLPPLAPHEKNEKSISDKNYFYKNLEPRKCQNLRTI